MPDSESPLILSLETATRAGSVALTCGPRLLALRAGEAQTSHSTKLLQRVWEVLEEACVGLPEVELYAAASGPGSFTGLRIGLATTKSFAATLKRSCVGIPTLAAVAHAAGRSRRTLAMIPAGRGEVFAQMFKVDENGAVTPLGAAVHQPPEVLLDSVVKFKWLKIAGEGAQLHELLLRERAGREGLTFVGPEATSHQIVSDEENAWHSTRPAESLALNVAALAYRSFHSGETVKPEQLAAVYVRPSDAELTAQAK